MPSLRRCIWVRLIDLNVSSAPTTPIQTTLGCIHSGALSHREFRYEVLELGMSLTLNKRTKAVGHRAARSHHPFINPFRPPTKPGCSSPHTPLAAVQVWCANIEEDSADPASPRILERRGHQSSHSPWIKASVHQENAGTCSLCISPTSTPLPATTPLPRMPGAEKHCPACLPAAIPRGRVGPCSNDGAGPSADESPEVPMLASAGPPPSDEN